MVEFNQEKNVFMILEIVLMFRNHVANLVQQKYIKGDPNWPNHSPSKPGHHKICVFSMFALWAGIANKFLPTQNTVEYFHSTWKTINYPWHCSGTYFSSFSFVRFSCVKLVSIPNWSKRVESLILICSSSNKTLSLWHFPILALSLTASNRTQKMVKMRFSTCSDTQYKCHKICLLHFQDRFQMLILIPSLLSTDLTTSVLLSWYQFLQYC